MSKGNLFDGIHPDTQTPPTVSRVGTSDNKWDEVHVNNVIATSGSFPSGIVITSPNGSGWLLTIDNTGAVNTSEPFIV